VGRLKSACGRVHEIVGGPAELAGSKGDWTLQEEVVRR
jgi:hypothetical protein